MLNRTTRYAIKSLVVMAWDNSGLPVATSALASQLNFSAKFLEAIAREMTVAALIKSHKDKCVGYTLANSADDIKLSTAVRALNAPMALAPCVSLNFMNLVKFVLMNNSCELHEILAKVRDVTLEIVKNTSIKDLAMSKRSL